ncbi:GntR family transcriptional regulator [Lactobacillus crispatus]|nr:GntR family transcriptional regulator [Lactobacillus crispatus]
MIHPYTNYFTVSKYTGHFKPGHLLSENQTRIKLNMSRTPIREAIKQLENEGLLVRQGQKKSLAILH